MTQNIHSGRKIHGYVDGTPWDWFERIEHGPVLNFRGHAIHGPFVSLQEVYP